MSNYGLGLVSPVASGGVAHYADTAETFSSGKLFSFRNEASEKAYVDFEGSFSGKHGNFSGNVIAGGYLSAAGLMISQVTAGNPVMQFAAGTTDTPSSSPESDPEAGWLEITVGGATRYIPFYT